MSYQQIILKVLESKHDWIPEYALEKVNTEWGWIGSSGGRRTRELAGRGLIERRKIGKYAEFRAKLVEPQQLALVK